MKSLNETELKSLIDWLRPQLVGAQLQDVWREGTSFFLDFYRRGLLQIEVDLTPNRVFLLLWSGREIRKRRPQPSPVVLFLAANARHKELDLLELREGQGRVVQMVLGHPGEECAIDLILIPQAPNIQARAGEKKISLNKPRTLEPRGEDRLFSVRWSNWTEYLDEVKKFRQKGQGAPVAGLGAAGGADREVRWRKDLTKKQDVLAKLRLAGGDEEIRRWQEFGERLKIAGDAPPAGDLLWDDRLSLAANRERAFRKAKELKAKREGQAARILILEKEIRDLESYLRDPSLAPAETPRKRGSRVLDATESRGRTLNLPSGLQAVRGRSARDNLAILRQARAWDYWIHLKDEPSAHAILFREKNQTVSTSDIEAVATWILRSGSGARIDLEGQPFEVLVVECRFVRPVKGDRMGRVTYHSPQVYRFASKRS